MTRETIAVDIDDVVAAENEGVRQFMNREHGYSHAPEDYLIEGEYWGYWERVLGVSEEQMTQWLREYHQSPDKSNLPVVEGATEAISSLKESFDLVVITSREDFLVESTHAWLESRFPQTFKGVEFVKVWSGDKKASKATIVEAVGANYLIDDNIEHCRLVAEIGRQALLFGEYGWNRTDTLPKGVIRVRNWREVLEFFENEK